MKKVLCVCLGNICRSPAAAGVLLHKLRERGLDDRVEVDSAGLIREHEGERPDARMRQAAEARGYTLPGRARPIEVADMESFDYILAMDQQNLDGLARLSRDPGHRGKISLFTRWLDAGELEIPDPYYGGQAGFERVLDLVERSAAAFTNHLEAELSG